MFDFRFENEKDNVAQKCALLLSFEKSPRVLVAKENSSIPKNKLNFEILVRTKIGRGHIASDNDHCDAAWTVA